MKHLSVKLVEFRTLKFLIRLSFNKFSFFTAQNFVSKRLSKVFFKNVAYFHFKICLIRIIDG